MGMTEAKVRDTEALGKKWGCEQVIAIGINEKGATVTVTWGASKGLCGCADVLGRVARDAVGEFIHLMVTKSEAGKEARGCEARRGGEDNVVRFREGREGGGGGSLAEKGGWRPDEVRDWSVRSCD
jgi:hypothetical protein